MTARSIGVLAAWKITLPTGNSDMAAAPQREIGWSARRQADALVSDLLIPAETLKVREEARAFAESVLRPAAYLLNTTPERARRISS